MLANANKGTYLVKNWQKYANVIYELPVSLMNNIEFESEVHRFSEKIFLFCKISL